MIYGFGTSFELDTDAAEIRDGGSVIPVEPQVFDVLAYLIAHRDRVVSREELLDNIWGDRFVSESALTSRLKSARRAVGDDGRTQAVIRTVHGRGYRFVAPLTDNDQPPRSAQPHGVEVSAAPPSPGPVGDPWPLLGRDDELALLWSSFDDPRVAGVLVTGSAGMGKSRLATEALARVAARGAATARATGHTEAQSVPLACLAHLLPPGLSALGGLDGELSRALLLQRALDAVEELAGGGRLFLLVDDVDRVDDLSQAVIAALVMNGRAFVVLTQRTEAGTVPALDHLVKAGPMTRLDLQPLPAEVLDVLLYRVLGDPVDSKVLDHLVRTSNGSPGVFRQLVEASIHAGSLAVVGGVWRRVGDLAAPPDLAVMVESRLDGLDDQSREAAELLAIAGSLDLELAVDLCGEEVLDALDLRGVLAIRSVEARAEVSLAHPLFEEVLRSRTGGLRGRRLRRRLADAMEGSGLARAGDRLRVARWRLDGGDPIDPDVMLEAARLALVAKDETTAVQLLDRLQVEAPSAQVTQLHAELLFRRGDTARVEALLAEVDLDELDEVARAQVIRRRVGNLFFGTWRFDQALELLTELRPRVSGAAGVTLDSYLLLLRVLAGDVRDALGAGEVVLLESVDGVVRMEVLRALGFALFMAGRLRDALQIVDECRSLGATLPPGLSRPGIAIADYTEILALAERGEMRQARDAADRLAPPGRALSWQPMGLARLALLEGRPDLVRERLQHPKAMADALGFDLMGAWIRSALAEAAVLEGDRAAAAALVSEVRPFIREPLSLVHLDMLWRVGMVEHATGDAFMARTTLIEGGERAAELGNVTLALGMWHSAAQLGAAAEAARLIHGLAAVFEGPGPRARVAEIEARAEGDAEALRQAAETMDRQGMVLHAARAYAGLAALLADTHPDGAREASWRARELATVNGGLLAI